MYKILIPTCKPKEELKPLLNELGKFSNPEDIIVSGFKASASTNRNYTLEKAGEGLVIMMDDDMTGFYTDWDVELISTLSEDNAMIASARLLRPDGTPGIMVGAEYDMDKSIVEVKARQLPTACIAFYNKGDVWFDENFRGSGFEDNDFSIQMNLANPEGKFLINNEVQLIHINEMKNQKNEFWQFNHDYFSKKWGIKWQ